VKEHPYWPVCEVRKAANGWLIRPAPDYMRPQSLSTEDDFYVFNDWKEVADFLLLATEAKRSAE
jgi:hypothetical protein